MSKLKYVRKVMVNITDTLAPYGVSARVQNLTTENGWCGLVVGLYHEGRRVGTMGIVDIQDRPIHVLITQGSPIFNPDANSLSFNVSPNHAHDAFDEFTANHVADWIGVDYD